MAATIRSYMSMLPSPGAPSGHPHVLIYVITSETSDLAQVYANMGAKPATSSSPFATFAKFPHVVAIVHRPSQADPRILESCDAFVASLDGSAGVDPKIVEFWSSARDFTLPRHILAFNVVNGRADFDELCAIASRVLEPDLLVRYLPIDSDDELSLTGVYDILTSEIHALIDGQWVTKAADPEHIAITSSAREDLFDQLAYLGLDDSTLENHTSGLPISVTKLETAWLHPDVVTITPIDDEVGVSTFSNWISILKPVWVPVLNVADTSCDAFEATERVGISITEHLARMWGSEDGSDLFENIDGELSPAVMVESNQVAIAGTGLTPGSTVATKNSIANLVAPTF
jgi:hypothetical protein